MTDLILIGEDERDIQELLEYNLRQDGFFTQCVGRGDLILPEIRKSKPALLLLDLMMPGLSGTEVCRQIRADKSIAQLPIIMVTAKDTEADRIVGLELGADDYITKPFSPQEVVARVKAVLRRSQLSPLVEASVLKSGEVKIDLKEHKVFLRESELQLTLTEFKILRELLARPGQVITRGKLGDVMGVSSEGTSRTIDVHLVALRKKMADAGDMIETVRGVGYRFRS
jgi:DNA-binding response OmpR family regulator